MNDDQFMQIMRALEGLEGRANGLASSLDREMREGFDSLHKALDARTSVLSRRKIGYRKDSKGQDARQAGVRFARTG